jgi:uncharacterized protein (TIGR02391 family)
MASLPKKVFKSSSEGIIYKNKIYVYLFMTFTIITHYSSLNQLWAKRFPITELGDLGRHIHFGEAQEYEDILHRDIPSVEEIAEKHLLKVEGKLKEIGFENLLHPIIIKNAYREYRDGHLHDAVLNSVIAVFDLIRQKTGLKKDGEGLIGKALSTKDPYLILSDLESDSGTNDQIGFIQIFQGAYKGIRNPKAHSLQHDLTEGKAAQYLIFASLLARRIDEAHVVKNGPKKLAQGKRVKKQQPI